MADKIYWAVLDISYHDILGGLQVVIKTDIAVHCWCRWSKTEPQKHAIPREVRGAWVGSIIDQCFVAYLDLEQEEAGYTLTHTFLFTDWPVCQTRWFFFWATKSGYYTKSATPLFSHHRQLALIPADCQTLAGQWGGFCQGWGADGQSFQPDHSYMANRLVVWMAHMGDARRGYFNVDIRIAGGQCWLEPQLFTQTIYSETIDPRPAGTKLYLLMDPAIPLLHGTDYHICLYTIPPWYKNTGSGWVRDDNIAAMWYAKKSYGSSYPRGEVLKGCGFNQGAGSWASFPTEDLYFCLWEVQT